MAEKKRQGAAPPKKTKRQRGGSSTTKKRQTAGSKAKQKKPAPDQVPAKKRPSKRKQHTPPPQPEDESASRTAAGGLPASAGKSQDRLPIVGIGASAGGLAALKQFFAQVPEDSGLTFVVVVHLSPEHKSHLAELLQPHVKMSVQQVVQTTPLEPNHVYVIPPGANLDTIDTHLRLTELEQRRQERAPIDHFFRTLAKTHDGDAIGVILTGTGSDGTLGIREIKERGGLAVVQEPVEAEYDGMPQSAIATGLVDLVLPVAEIPAAVLRFTRTQPRLPTPEEDEEPNGDVNRLLQKVFAQLRARTGRDFSRYKRSTILRRIQRRMQLHELEDVSGYLDRLRKAPAEVGTLADDLLITVTSFFRDAEVFEKLQKSVIPELFEGKGDEDEIRAWSVGCATGEEAYSLAMLLVEEAGRREAAPPRLQVFASDLHEHSLQKARDGVFSGDIETDVSPERLKRFFTKESGGYRIRKEVRELVVFAPHNLLGDPPFSRIDLVACRNVLIYLQRSTQGDVVELFHYALRPDGFLVLGSSETVETRDLFRIVDKKHCIYRKRNVVPPEPRLPVFPMLRATLTGEPKFTQEADEPIAYGTLHQLMVERYAPPSALVSPDDKVVHLSEHAGRYFVQPGGEPTTNVFKLVREELRIELRSSLQAARERGEAKRSMPIPVRFDGATCPVVLDVRPALQPQQSGFILLIFNEWAPGEPESSAAASKRPDPKTSATRSGVLERELEAELGITKQRLQAVIEEYETGQEEMKASNEEMQSANEELRSTMEELETSKEELQSMNEELQTVNQENRHKVEELAQLTGDLQNFLAATDIATLFLDRDLRIMRFTPKLGELFNIRITDRGRPLSDLTHRLGYDRLHHDAKRVLDDLIPIEQEVADESGRWYLTRLTPYRSTDDRIEGVVITFVEIMARKNAESEVRQAKDHAEQIIEALPEPLVVLTSELEVRSANAAFYEHFAVAPEQTVGRKIYRLGNGQWDIPELRRLLEEVLPDNSLFKDYLVEHEFEGLGRRVMLLNGRRLEPVQLILLGIHDITERHDAHRQLRHSEDRLQRIVNIEGIGVLAFQESGVMTQANGAFQQMLGYSRQDVESGALTWRTITPPEYIEISERQWRKLKETGRIGPYEKECLRKDGSRTWMLFVGASLGDGAVVKYCVDVSDRKAAEEALRESQNQLTAELAAMIRLHELVAQLLVSPDLSAALDEVLAASIDIVGTDMGTVQVWDAETETLQLVAHRGFEEGFVDYFRVVAMESGSACARAARTLDRIIVEDIQADTEYEPHREVAAGAGYRAVQSTPLASRSGEILGVLSTHYRQPHHPSERDLRILDLYARQAADFIEHARNKEEAKLASRRKDEFLATLAHELRNPLAPISTGLEILNLSEDRLAALDDVLPTMERQTRQLVALVDDLLDVSRITRGKLELKRRHVNLSDVIQSAVEASTPLFDELQHDFTLDVPGEPIRIDADPHRLAQVVSNLLNNAAKYTPRQGRVSLSAKCQGGELVVAVRDTGVGIAAEQVESIFEMFGQIERLPSGGGLGIGLTLVKSLVEMHGGSIAVASVGAGQGTTFTVRLPVIVDEATAPIEAMAPIEATGPESTGPEPTDPSGLRILMVEDSKPAADLLCRVVKMLGNEVCVAYDGEEAIAMAAQFRPDVVIMDIGMPNMDGCEAARRIREQPWGENVFLIALTGWGQEADKKRTSDAGFDHHLVKPPEAAELRRLLSEAKANPV